MTDSTIPRRACARITWCRHSRDTGPASAAADLVTSGVWPLLPVCAARMLSIWLLVLVVLGALTGAASAADAQPTETLLSNADPAPSARLLLVNVTQRRVAQEFTTGPHPPGYDVYAVAVHTEQSSGRRNMGLQGVIRNRRWEPVGPWGIMLPHRQVGPTLTRSRPVADLDWSWFMSPEPIRLDPNETYFFELICRWGCYDLGNRVGLGLTKSNDEDDESLPGWSMADGFMVRSTKFNRWWGDLVVGTDGFFQPNPRGPVMRLAIRGEPREVAGPPSGDAGVPEVSASDVQAREAPRARLAFPVRLSSASAEPVTVRYATADGTATAGADYMATAGRLVFAPGQTERTVEVPVVHDTRSEGPETLALRLSGATGARLADAEATGTIVNAGPGPREWMARFGRVDVWHVADTGGQGLEGAHPYATTVETAREPPGAAAPQPAFPARGAEPARADAARDAGPARADGARGAEPARTDAARILVGLWRTRFGAMPVPPAAPAPGTDAGAGRARSSGGGQALQPDHRIRRVRRSDAPGRHRLAGGGERGGQARAATSRRAS